MLTRRTLFGVLAGAVAAPIVVRSGILMPVKALIVPSENRWEGGILFAEWNRPVALGDSITIGQRGYVVTAIADEGRVFSLAPGIIA